MAGDDLGASTERSGSGVWTASSFFSPPVCAVAALTLAVVAVLVSVVALAAAVLTIAGGLMHGQQPGLWPAG